MPLSGLFARSGTLMEHTGPHARRPHPSSDRSALGGSVRPGAPVRVGAAAMSPAQLLALVLVALLFLYLCAALLKPEWFE